MVWTKTEKEVVAEAIEVSLVQTSEKKRKRKRTRDFGFCTVT